jgi:hypothetical protein
MVNPFLEAVRQDGRMAAAATANHTSSPAHRLIVTWPGKSNKIKDLD